MGGGLEDVRPDIVHQVLKSILAIQTLDAQRQVLDGPSSSLPVDQISVHQCVFQDWSHCVNIVLAHFANIFEHEAQTLQDTILHVQLGYSVLVHESRQHREGTTGLSDDGDGYSGADTKLSLLNFEVVQQGAEHIVRTDGLRDVAKGVDRGSSNSLLLRLEQLQKIEANTIPLSRRSQLCSSVGDSPYQVDAVFLDLLVSVLENRSQSGEQILDGRSHLGHTNDVDDGLHSTQDRTQNLWVLFAQILVEEQAQVTHHLLLAALLHHDGDTGDEIGSLLSDARRRRVQAPPDDTRDLGQVGLHSRSEGVHYCAEAVEHDRGIVRGLLLEGVDNSINDLLL
mmetsp:Transcript_34471/g.51075  ORF Transcript_34471/g.51075 Transcript_34471/m.51075 type:complete len:339 (+) Transcript_34471:347-1363(+)